MTRKITALTPMQCRAARALLDWTQQELADIAQVSRATVRDFEQGKHDAHRSTECMIREALLEAGITLATDPLLGEGVFLRRNGSGSTVVPESLGQDSPD